jgi:hypothetical protein
VSGPMASMSVSFDCQQLPLPCPPDAPIGSVTAVGLLANGTVEGRAIVGLVVELEDGTKVLASTTWRLFNNAARALAASPIAQEEAKRP